jgi:hypothetical protein
MKNLLFICSVIFLTLFSTTKSHAQLSFLVDFGIRGGISSATFVDSKQEVDDRRTGVMAGVYASVIIPRTPFSIQPELLYSQKGAEINGTTTDLSYIEIPVLAKFNFIKSNTLKSRLYFGPYVGFNINAEENPESDLGPLEDEVKNNDFGLTFGADVEIQRINLGIRYSAGLTEVFENEEARNSVISIVAGIGF